MSRQATPDQVLAGTLRRMREERGLTLEELAFRAGITVSAVSRIELSRTTPGWDTVRLIANALDVSMVDLSAAVESASGHLAGRQREHASIVDDANRPADRGA
jgi:transcriptional regulator with XRE-family HTH domain